MDNRWKRIFDLMIFVSLITFGIAMNLLKEHVIEKRVLEKSEIIKKEVFYDNIKNYKIETSPTIYEYYEIKKIDLKPRKRTICATCDK